MCKSFIFGAKTGSYSCMQIVDTFLLAEKQIFEQNFGLKK